MCLDESNRHRRGMTIGSPVPRNSEMPMDEPSRTLATEADLQVLPELSRWEYTALRASIDRFGIIAPVIRDESGQLIDGHHRVRACAELGISRIPTVTLAGLSDAEKRDQAFLLNTLRRRISRKERRRLIAVELRRQPELSNRYLAEVMGVTDRTVRSVRAELIAGAEIPHVEQFLGRDGKRYRSARIYSETRQQRRGVEQAIEELGDSISPVQYSHRQIRRIASRSRLGKRASGSTESLADVPIHHANFEDWRSGGLIEAHTIDLILTDPPYAKAFSPQFEALARFADWALTEGGILCVYVGNIQLADAVSGLSSKLIYRATGCSTWTSDGSIIHPTQCVARAGIVLVFSRGKWRRRTRWNNHHVCQSVEKQWHPWQKPLSDVSHWLQCFSEPGQMVCDPMVGGGTTAVACARNGRQFIGGDIDKSAIEITQRRLRWKEPPQQGFDGGSIE